MSGELKINRIKSANRGSLALLGEVAKQAQATNPILRETAINRDQFRRMEDSMSALGKYCRKNGFDPTRQFQHVANFDNGIWLLILEMFGKYDEDGNLIDDGLLYKRNSQTGNIELNKDFFYALVSYLESCGFQCDMRGKIILS